MTDADLQITFAADASGVVRGVQQAQAAVADFGPRIEAMGQSFGELTGRVKDGFDGIKGLADGLKTASASGAEGLAGLADAAGGVVGVAGTVAEVAASAAGAIADWAAQTANSTTASAEARQNATDLNEALGEANQTFGEAGGILANAFAPALTELVTGLANLVRGFVDAYSHGTTLKTGLEWLVIALKATFTPIMALGEGFQNAWIVVQGVWRAMSDGWSAVQSMFKTGVAGLERLFQSLATTISDALSGNWAGAAQSAMQGIGAAGDAAANLSKERQDAARQIGADGQSIAGGLGAHRGSEGVGLHVAGKLPAGAGSHGQRQGGHQGHNASTPAAVASDCPSQAAASACAQADAATEAANQQSVDRQVDGKVTGEKDAAQQISATGANLNDQLATLYHGDTEAFHKATADKVASGQQLQNDLTKADAEGNAKRKQQDQAAANAFKQQWDSAIKPLVSSFANGLMQMAEGTKSFVQVVRGLGQQMLQAWVNNIAKLVSEWARGMLQHVAMTHTTNAAVTASNQAAANTNLLITLETNLKKAASDAVSAAKGAYAWATPWGGPIAGAIAAAAAFAGVMGLDGLASADGGFDIPVGVNPLTQLHAEEMVLPARLANPMRAMMDDYAGRRSDGGAGAAAAVGDTHIHNWSVSAVDGPSVERFLRTHSDRMVKVLNERMRANAGVALGYAR